jgi:mono/diheme cytochrome c family protein
LLVSVRRVVRLSLLSIVGLLVLIQLVPYGRDHTNPPASAEPAWDSARTRALADAACFDCHSNETRWPWYTNVAPFSWLTQNDVDNGREALNFSEWDRPQEEAGEAAEAVMEGEMPPRAYTWLHPDAKLSAEERDALIRGLIGTLGTGKGDDD